MKVKFTILFLIFACVKLTSQNPSHALSLIFWPVYNDPSYQITLDDLSDTLTLSFPDKLKKIKLDSAIVNIIFRKGIEKIETINVDTSHRASISNSLLNIQITHNYRGRMISIYDEYYFKKAKDYVDMINAQLPTEDRIPINSADFSSLPNKAGDFRLDTVISISQNKFSLRDEISFYYNSDRRDSSVYSYFKDKQKFKNVYLLKTDYQYLLSHALKQTANFKFHYGSTISQNDSPRYELNFQYGGLSITDSYFSFKEYKKDLDLLKIVTFLNKKIAKEKRFD